MFPLILYELFLYILWQKNCIGIFSVDFLQITSRRVLVFNCHRVAIRVNKNIILDFWMPVFILTLKTRSSLSASLKLGQVSSVTGGIALIECHGVMGT
jgi:hypothetical protein